MSLLDIRGLEVRYGQVSAVRGIDVSVAGGTVLAVLGPNGAGKTSTVRAIAGALPRRGDVYFDGAPAPSKSWRCRKAGIAHVPEGRHVFGSLSVAENLRLGGFGRRSVDLSEIYDLLPRLAERQSQVAGTLSGGEQQMLAIGRALVAQPRLLLLDEPTLGLAPAICDDVFDRISAIRDAGVTLIIVEQKTASALALADAVIVLRNGRIVASGPPSAFADPETLTAAYLAAEPPATTQGDH